ncbi:hypothetical protein [Sphingomonas sp.]|jgi:hypothetical protein|uniref:hypothetical protein n=1 Tax=Sphingomonas sp. TaxID=28214 RepID=UPI003F6FA5CF
MTGRDRFRSTPDAANSEQQRSQERLTSEYRRFLDKVVQEHPELKGLGKDRR